jgi:transposase
MERRLFTREFKLEAVRLIKERGVSYAQASEDLGVHPTQLRNTVKQLADDPQHAFPGQGQMKPEQLEIAQLNSASFGQNLNEEPLKRAQAERNKAASVGARLLHIRARVIAHWRLRHADQNVGYRGKSRSNSDIANAIDPIRKSGLTQTVYCRDVLLV